MYSVGKSQVVKNRPWDRFKPYGWSRKENHKRTQAEKTPPLNVPAFQTDLIQPTKTQFSSNRNDQQNAKSAGWNQQKTSATEFDVGGAVRSKSVSKSVQWRLGPTRVSVIPSEEGRMEENETQLNQADKTICTPKSIGTFLLLPATLSSSANVLT